MFDIDVCEAKRILLVRFHGPLSERDFAELDALAATRKAADLYDCIFDLSEVEKVELATEFVSRRGDLPQTFKDRQRIYVVPQDDLKLLVRVYCAYQKTKGWREPVAVEKLEAALSMLGASAAEFSAFQRSDPLFEETQGPP